VSLHFWLLWSPVFFGHLPKGSAPSHLFFRFLWIVTIFQPRRALCRRGSFLFFPTSLYHFLKFLLTSFLSGPFSRSVSHRFSRNAYSLFFSEHVLSFNFFLFPVHADFGYFSIPSPFFYQDPKPTFLPCAPFRLFFQGNDGGLGLLRTFREVCPSTFISLPQ